MARRQPEGQRLLAAEVELGIAGVQVHHDGGVFTGRLAIPVKVGQGQLVPLRFLVESQRRTGGPAAGGGQCPGEVAERTGGRDVGGDGHVRLPAGRQGEAARAEAEHAERRQKPVRAQHVEVELQLDRLVTKVVVGDDPLDRVTVVREVAAAEADAGRQRDDGLVDRPGHVQQAGALLERGVAEVGHDRAHQRRLELGRLPVVVLLRQQGGCTGHMWRGH